MKIGEQDDFFKVQKIKTEFQVLLEGIRMRNTVCEPCHLHASVNL